MNKSYSFIAAAIMALAPIVLNGSCSSSDSNDDDIIEVASKSQRLEISISGDYSQFDYSVMFFAYDKDGKSADMKTSLGGVATSYWNILSTDTAFTDVYASVDGKGKSLSAAITFVNAFNHEGTVTVSAKVIEDGKTVREQSKDIKISSVMDGASIEYSPEYGFSSIN